MKYQSRKYFLLLYLIVFSTVSKSQTPTDIINWNENPTVSWDDFKGAPKQTNKNQAAAISTGIALTSEYKAEQNILEIIIHAQKNPIKSWYIKKYASDRLLNHEQKHFDLSEVYARKLRRTLSEKSVKPNKIANLSKRNFKKFSKELFKMQDRYDKETNHGLSESKQDEWNKKISNWLEELTNYKNPIIQRKI